MHSIPCSLENCDDPLTVFRETPMPQPIGCMQHDNVWILLFAGWIGRYDTPPIRHALHSELICSDIGQLRWSEAAIEQTSSAHVPFKNHFIRQECRTWTFVISRIQNIGLDVMPETRTSPSSVRTTVVPAPAACIHTTSELKWENCAVEKHNIAVYWRRSLVHCLNKSGENWTCIH